MENRRLTRLARWSKRLEKKHKKINKQLQSLRAEYERFFVEYNKVIPEVETLEEIQDGVILDDLRETFELDI